MVAWLEQSGAPGSGVGLPSIEAPLAVLTGGAVSSLLLLQYLGIVAIRTFVTGSTRSIPSEYYTRNIVFVFVNIVLGGIAVTLLVFAGSILLLVPGIIAYVAFSFTVFFIAVEDESFVAALRDSWTLTRGHWFRLFVLLLIVTVSAGIVSGILSTFGNLVIGAIAGQALGTLVAGLLSLPFSLLILGILAAAFDQLRDEQVVSLSSSASTISCVTSRSGLRGMPARSRADIAWLNRLDHMRRRSNPALCPTWPVKWLRTQIRLTYWHLTYL